MQKYYKISEISELYNIGIDSLRYYEKLEILKPRRGSNNYRLYSLKDIYRLNIICDLRKLDFSMAQIKTYLDNQNINNTLSLLHKEKLLLHERIQELKEKERLIQARIFDITEALKLSTGVITIKTLSARPCIELCEYITRNEEMDLLIKKLHRKHEAKIRDLGNQAVGAYVSMSDIEKGISNTYNSVFFLLEESADDYDFLLPSGRYLSYLYHGPYDQNCKFIQKMLAFAKEQNLKLAEDPFEIYWIDNNDTGKAEEYLTEILIQILDVPVHT